MPKTSEKEKIVHFLIKTATDEISFADDDDEVDKMLDDLHDDLCCVLSCRRGVSNPVPKASERQSNIFTTLDDEQFQYRFRVTRTQFGELFALFCGDIVFEKSHSSQQFSKELQLAIVLYRLGISGEEATHKKIATQFGIGDGGTITNITHRVFRAILKLQKKYIYWPNEAERTKLVTASCNELPLCVGYVGGTELKLAESSVRNGTVSYPKEDWYSVKAQIVCDYKLRIRYVVVGHPGTADNAHIFRSSALFQSQEKFFSGNQYIVGDATYPLSERLITPYRSNSQDIDRERKREFNLRHRRYGVRVENCFGLLKKRFGSLKQLRIRLQNEKSYKFLCDWFMVYCILHNILNTDSDLFKYEETFVSAESPKEPLSTIADDELGEIKRKRLSVLKDTNNIPKRPVALSTKRVRATNTDGNSMYSTDECILPDNTGYSTAANVVVKKEQIEDDLIG